MGYGYQVRYSDPQVLSRCGFSKVAHVPCIFDSSPKLHRAASQFLIDRALGIWEPKSRGKEVSPIPPSFLSIKNYASRLCNFLDWCEAEGVNPLAADYNSEVISGYQKAMVVGRWSRDGRPLRESTINVRVDVVVDYLSWCADKGFREEFFVPKIIKLYFDGRSEQRDWMLGRTQGRIGKLHEVNKRLSFPDENEIIGWRVRVAQRVGKGIVEGLIADLILETAIRREEAACWRNDTLPQDQTKWDVINPNDPDEKKIVLVELRYGTKGKEYGRDHGDKIGPSGIIRVPYSLAIRLQHYSQIERAFALAQAVRVGATIAQQRKIRDQSVHLFLKPDTGKRYTGEDIYEFWRRAHPPHGWSPHAARDYWACCVLWERIEQYRKFLEEISGSDVQDEILSAFRMNVETVIRLEIQPQLRHASRETTLVYLQWVTDRLGINLNLNKKWMNSFA